MDKTHFNYSSLYVRALEADVFDGVYLDYLLSSGEPHNDVVRDTIDQFDCPYEQKQKYFQSLRRIIRKFSLDETLLDGTMVGTEMEQEELPMSTGVVIALTEERDYFIEYLRLKGATIEPKKDESTGDYHYYFELPDDLMRGVMVCVETPGSEQATRSGERLVTKFQLKTLVNLGISGSLHSDAAVGDVVVAELVDLLQNSAVEDSKTENGRFVIQPSGTPIYASPDIVRDSKNLRHMIPSLYANLHDRAGLFWQAVESNCVDKKQIDGIIRSKPSVLHGKICCDKHVVKSPVYKKWLKDNRERKYLAIDNESGGVGIVTVDRKDIDLIIIRGISDPAEVKKKTLLERIKFKDDESPVRRYAMDNAVIYWLEIMGAKSRGLCKSP